MAPGVQKSWNALTPEERVRRRAATTMFTSSIDKRSYYAQNKRFGCIDYGRDDANDPASSAAGPSTAHTTRTVRKNRKFKHFYDHQVIAAHHLIKMRTDVGYVQHHARTFGLSCSTSS